MMGIRFFSGFALSFGVLKAWNVTPETAPHFWLGVALFVCFGIVSGVTART